MNKINSWEDLIKTLPSDETLEKMEKDGTLDEFDRRLKLLGEAIERMKERAAQRDKELKELEEMLKTTENQEETNIIKK